jgi:hypothetical protein
MNLINSSARFLHGQIQKLSEGTDTDSTYKVHAAADAGKAIANLLRVKLDHLKLVDNRKTGARE